MRLSELTVRLIRPLDSHRLKGHDAQEVLNANQEAAHILRTVYRSKLKRDAEIQADMRRARIVKYIHASGWHVFTAPRLQLALGISKQIMQSDLKILRENKQIGFSYSGKVYGYFAK